MPYNIGRTLCYAICVLVAASPATYAAAAELVGVVDIQRLVNESIIGKAAHNDLESETRKRQLALAGKKAELEKLKEEISKQAAVLSAGAIEEKKSALGKRGRDFEQEVQDQREELQRKNSAAMGKVVLQIDEVIKEVALQKKYAFIIERDDRLVIYADTRLDITDQVLKLLDSKKIGM